MGHVVSVETVGIAADGGCCLEGTPCFLKVAMLFVNDGGRLTSRMVLIAFSVCTSYMIGNERASAAAMRETHK